MLSTFYLALRESRTVYFYHMAKETKTHKKEAKKPKKVAKK